MCDLFDMAQDLEQAQRDLALRAVTCRPAVAADCAHCEENPAALTHNGLLSRYCARCANELGLTL